MEEAIAGMATELKDEGMEALWDMSRMLGFQ